MVPELCANFQLSSMNSSVSRTPYPGSFLGEHFWVLNKGGYLENVCNRWPDGHNRFAIDYGKKCGQSTVKEFWSPMSRSCLVLLYLNLVFFHIFFCHNHLQNFYPINWIVRSYLDGNRLYTNWLPPLVLTEYFGDGVIHDIMDHISL